MTTVATRPAARWGWPSWRVAKSSLWQAAALLAVVALVLWLGRNVGENMARRNISFGFAFLARPAGFDIPFHLLGWDAADTYGRALLVATVNMALAAGLAILLASALGLGLALMRLSSNPLAAGIARGLVEVLRNTPQLIQIIFVYFAVLQVLPGPRQSIALGAGLLLNVRGLFIPTPTALPWPWIAAALALAAALAVALRHLPGAPRPVLLPAGMVVLAGAIAAGWAATWQVPALRGFNVTGGLRLPPELLALCIGLSTYACAFISEIIRAAIQAIPRGQTEAALSLGLRPSRTMRLVVLPQAIRVLIPPLTSQYLNIIKSTTLGAAIAYPEIVQVFARTVLNQSGRAVECMALVLCVFLGINLLTAAAMNLWNRRLELRGP